jgi:hypothetical protein
MSKGQTRGVNKRRKKIGADGLTDNQRGQRPRRVVTPETLCAEGWQAGAAWARSVVNVSSSARQPPRGLDRGQRLHWLRGFSAGIAAEISKSAAVETPR